MLRLLMMVPLLSTMTANALPKYTAKAITITEGLSQNMVQCMLRDSRGYLRIGTRWGQKWTIDSYDRHM